MSWLASQPLGETQGDGWQQTAPSSRVRPQPPQSSCWASEKLPQVTRAQWQLRVTPWAPIAGAGCQEAPQPQQEGAAGATGVHARLGPPCPPLSAATPTGPRPARTRAHAPYTVIHALGTLRAAQRAPQTPDTPRRLRALHAQAERAQAPAALRPPAPARSPEPPSHGCRRDTRRSPAAVRAGTRMPAWTWQGHVCGSWPPGLGALQGASYFREPSLAGEGGLAWRACHRAHNTPLALGSPS